MKYFFSILATLLVSEVAAVPANKPAKPSGRIIIGFNGGEADREKGKSAAAEALGKLNNPSVDKRPVYESSGLRGEGGFQVFNVGNGNEEAIIKALTSGNNQGRFKYVEMDLELELDSMPNDPYVDDMQWQHTVMQTYEAWDITTGSSSVTIGICDTGVQLDHPDLQDNMLEGYDAISQTWGGDVGTFGGNQHGTFCAGCAAALGDNGEGVSGTGWHFKHRPGQVASFNSDGRVVGYSSHINDCIVKMCEKEDVKAVGVSWSGGHKQGRLDAASLCRQHGTLVVTSAGNSNVDTSQYGNYDDDDIIVVGSSTSSDHKSSFSNYGTWVDIWAPGSSVGSTTIGSTYRTGSGTSYSCPIVAGLIGLIWSVNPALTPDEVENILKSTATPNKDLPGGAGRANSLEAVKAALQTLQSNDGPVPAPTDAPVPEPTDAPIPEPTDAPVPAPTDAPVPAPTMAPVEPTMAPVPSPTAAPTERPTKKPKKNNKRDRRY